VSGSLPAYGFWGAGFAVLEADAEDVGAADDEGGEQAAHDEEAEPEGEQCGDFGEFDGVFANDDVERVASEGGGHLLMIGLEFGWNAQQPEKEGEKTDDENKASEHESNTDQSAENLHHAEEFRNGGLRGGGACGGVLHGVTVAGRFGGEAG
jgi:hypothetical protein